MTITTRVGKLTVINDWIQKRIPPLSMSHALRNTDSVKHVSERTDYPDETQNSVLPGRERRTITENKPCDNYYVTTRENR